MKGNTIGGWVKPHVSVTWRLAILADIAQQGPRHTSEKLSKVKRKLMWNKLGYKWIAHAKEWMEQAHPMEGSFHPRGQVVTLHPTKQG